MRNRTWTVVLLAALVAAWGLAGCEAKKPDTAAPDVTQTKPTEMKPADLVPTDVKPAETKPVEVTPAETKPVETKPAEVKPVEPAKPMKPGYPEPAAVKACAKAPEIDGDLSDACWKTAEIPGVWVDVYTGRAAKPQGRIYACYDDKNLYIAFENPEPRMKNLVADATDRDGNVWEDDSNELFIDPSAGKKEYFQFIGNTKNVLYDGRGKDGTWNSSTKTAVKQAADGWTVEIAIPLAEIGAAVPLKGQTWTANFCRNRCTEGETQAVSWSDTGESFHNPEAFGKLKLE